MPATSTNVDDLRAAPRRRRPTTRLRRVPGRSPRFTGEDFCSRRVAPAHRHGAHGDQPSTRGVVNAVPRGHRSGTLHDTVPATTIRRDRQRTLRFTVVTHPSITIDKTGSTAGGPAPQNVVYTYDGQEHHAAGRLPTDSASVERRADRRPLRAAAPTPAATPTATRGLQIAETWTYTCTSVLPQRRRVHQHRQGRARQHRVADNIPKNYCSPPDTWTVTVTPPPPASAGRSRGRGQAPVPSRRRSARSRTPSGLKVRKGEVTTIKLTVRNVDAGSVARITLPGGKVVTRQDELQGRRDVQGQADQDRYGDDQGRGVLRGRAADGPARAAGRRPARAEGHRLT